jgi:excisionase family DNA binding protein
VLLGMDDAAERLGIGRWLLYQLIARNEVQSVRIGRRRLVPASSIDAYLDRLMDEQEGDYLSGRRA